MRANHFKPQPLLRNPHIQSVLASSRLRRWLFRKRDAYLEREAREHIIECGNGVRLQGFLTQQKTRTTSRGLVIFLHGWEGSVNSTYVLQSGARLLTEGYDIFRLNFRDHGETHHLNEGLFHSCRLEETVEAIKAISLQFPQKPLVIIGFSLGGNFALRIALRAPEANIPLSYVIAVCPVISPQAGLTAIEQAPWFYEYYFVKKWRSSLKRKQSLHPHRKFFSLSELRGNLRDLTRSLVLRHTQFGSLDNYLEGYSIAGDRLASLPIPATILTAQDDPIIPAADFHALTLSPTTQLEIAPYGGHCGFISNLSLRSWVEDFIVAQLERMQHKNSGVI